MLSIKSIYKLTPRSKRRVGVSAYIMKLISVYLKEMILM